MNSVILCTVFWCNTVIKHVIVCLSRLGFFIFSLLFVDVVVIQWPLLSLIVSLGFSIPLTCVCLCLCV